MTALFVPSLFFLCGLCGLRELCDCNLAVWCFGPYAPWPGSAAASAEAPAPQRKQSIALIGKFLNKPVMVPACQKPVLNVKPASWLTAGVCVYAGDPVEMIKRWQTYELKLEQL